MTAIMAARGQELEQDFDFFVVIDFEATCLKDRRIFPQEIIEFPAVLVDGATGRIESVFRREFTGIQQEDVDGGVDLGEALWLHDAWLKAATAGAGNKRSVRLAVLTWGDWDCRTMLEFECRFKGIEKPSYFDQWINLRIPFQAALDGGGWVNLKETVRAGGLDWEGRLHCGLDNALNTARLLAEIMRRGVKMTITGSMAPPLPPLTIQKQPPCTSPCGGSSALVSPPTPIQQHPPRTGPLALVPPPIQQQLLLLQPHISNYGGYSPACLCYGGLASRGGVMQAKCFLGCANWAPAMGAQFAWSN